MIWVHVVEMEDELVDLEQKTALKEKVISGSVQEFRSHPCCLWWWCSCSIFVASVAATVVGSIGGISIYSGVGGIIGVAAFSSEPFPTQGQPVNTSWDLRYSIFLQLKIPWIAFLLLYYSFSSIHRHCPCPYELSSGFILLPLSIHSIPLCGSETYL